MAARASRRRRLRTATTLLLLALAALHPAGTLAGGADATSGPAPAGAQEEAAKAWVVIVHPSNPVRSMTSAELGRIYRRRTLFWPGGAAVQPLNLETADPLRRAFTRAVLGIDEDALATWWNRQYYQGLRPPAVLRSTAAVKAYVAATPSAIGYVAAQDVDASVAAVEVRDGR